MVKGVSRRVIVVRSPDPRLFEQAIFIVRENAGMSGVTADQVVEEARRVASGYVKRNSGWNRWVSRIPAPIFLIIGAGITGIAWLITNLF